jgi:hypothetical protein
MPNIKIDDKDYDLDQLPEAARAQIFHLRAIEAEMNRMNTLLAVMGTARSAYLRALKAELEKLGG